MKPINIDRFITKKSRYKTDYLFSTPSFIKGAGSVINIFGGKIPHVTFEDANEADYAAIRNDFRMVGQEISDSFKKNKEDSELQFEK